MKNKKYIIFTAIFCIAFALVVTVTAASYIKTIEVSTDINLSLNGQSFIPKDAGGNPVEVFVYNGTTYVPIRAISEAFGCDVSYDANTKTAIINEKDTVAPTQTEPAPETTPPSETQPIVEITPTPEPPKDTEEVKQTQIVYWIDTGEVWHVRISCSTLSRSKNIHSGTIEESGKSRVCKVCG